jgi:hypothetical protein
MDNNSIQLYNNKDKEMCEGCAGVLVVVVVQILVIGMIRILITVVALQQYK